MWRADFTNEGFAKHIHEHLGVDVSGQDFLPFQDVEDSVREDMVKLRASSLIPDDVVINGAVYDVDTGKMTQVME